MEGSGSYSPNPAALGAGQSVVFRNGDSVTHHIASDTAGLFDTGTLAPGATSPPIVINNPGTVPYHCTIHPSMVGTLGVQSPSGSPAAAMVITVSGMDGGGYGPGAYSSRGVSSFSPDPATLIAGQAVVWRNADSVTHHIVSDSVGLFDAGTLAPGATSAPVVINTPGSVPYHCAIHPSMVGSLNVQPPSDPAAAMVITVASMGGSNSYAPNPATLRVGQAVVWRNADTVTHRVVSDSGLFDTGDLAPGASSAPVVINGAGTLAYHCAIHPSMVGTLNVQ